MKFKKVIAFLLVFVMTAALMTGCSSKGGGDTQTKDNAGTTEGAKTEGTAESGTASGEANGEVVTLKWIQVGSGMPLNYDAWLAHINPILEEKIGVNIDVEVVTWGDWTNRRSVITNSGEYFDILFTDSTRYNAEVTLGSFLDITELLKTEAPDLYAYIPEDYWTAVSVGGKIYSVPTYKDSSATQYFVWDKAMAEKYGIDYANIHTLQDAYEPLKKIKEGEGTSPYVMDKSGADILISIYDQMGSGLPPMGVRYDDETRTVVNTLEQEEILTQLDLIHKMYNEGIINADAPNAEQVPDYRMFFTAQGWSGAAKSTWGPNMGVEAEAIQFMDTIVSNTTVRGSLNGISSSSKYPEKCLQFLQLINMDTQVRDAFYYGLEGENFKYTEDGKVERINNEWKMAGYTQGTFFNVSQLSTDEFNQWDEVMELNKNAKPSVLLGFNLDTSNIETELANCRAVYEKYRSEFFTGAREPRELVKTITNELKTAGFEKVMAEAQSQIDAAYK